MQRLANEVISAILGFVESAESANGTVSLVCKAFENLLRFGRHKSMLAKAFENERVDGHFWSKLSFGSTFSFQYQLLTDRGQRIHRLMLASRDTVVYYVSWT